MEFFVKLVLFILATIIASTIGRIVADALDGKFKPCDITFVNNLYVFTLTETFIGCFLCGLVGSMFHEGFKEKLMHGLMAFAIYGLFQSFTRIKTYNKICEDLNTLNINTNEQFKELIEKESNDGE